MLQRYSRPLTGIVAIHNVDYLFWCLAGQTDEVQIWAYTHVTSEEKERLLTSGGALPEVMREVTAGTGGCVVAIASDDNGILLSEFYQPGITFGDASSALEAMQSLARLIETVNARAGAFAGAAAAAT